MKNSATTTLRALSICMLMLGIGGSAQAQSTGRRVIAHVVALDQPYMFNRLGAAQPAGMIYALLRDIVPIDKSKGLVAGNVRLRSGKRPRPIVLRVNQGDTLTIYFTNYLKPATPGATLSPYPPQTVTMDTLASGLGATETRYAGIHIMGLQPLDTINSDGTWAGANDDGQVAPGGSTVYTLYAPEQGSFLLYSMAATASGTGNSKPGAFSSSTFNVGQMQLGLFGSVAVEPPGAEWYRSQVTQLDLAAATTKWIDSTGKTVTPLTGYPVINYQAQILGVPVLSMLQKAGADSLELVYSDLTAVITGPNAGPFTNTSNDPTFDQNPAYPNRTQPYREIVLHYHEPQNAAVQAFPTFYGSQKTLLTSSGGDNFAINYGIAGIGPEIYANRIGVGPMDSCVNCAYEEFFLSSWAVGDPAMVVDIPANASSATTGAADSSLQTQMMYSVGATVPNPPPTPALGPKASVAYFPDDPSNVYHSYLGDHTVFRVHHAGAGVTHIHHQHAHQWLRSPNSANSDYLDSQTIDPGSSYTLDMTYFGSGNKNLTVGDQIFHCHFYPHFAQGMWGLWRVHDVLETGSILNPLNGHPIAGTRALPDAEIKTGTPIPAIVPLPTLAMAPVPGAVAIDQTSGQIVIKDTTRNPGFPFFIPGVSGSRAPQPPMDFASGVFYKPDGYGGMTRDSGTLNGGLPRHVVVGGKVVWQQMTSTDWTKIIDTLVAIQLPDSGTTVEKVAMSFHAVRNHTTVTPSGATGATFTTNGRPPAPGAPFADPAVDMNGNPIANKRVYKAAAIQMDAVFNKKGWHFPQQRMLMLWDDVKPTIAGTRPPQPFFFRVNSNEYVEFQHTNLVPGYYELDNFQVRTPTDIIGQHIHLVKFDVTSSDGAANGFNYEDGTFAPDQVVERIHGINDGQLYAYKFRPGVPVSSYAGLQSLPDLAPTMPDTTVFGQPPSYNQQSWLGAQTTIQRWYADPLLNNAGVDRTMRTVFTHDHFGPSTHQQAGLYAGLLIEPSGSLWIDPVTGDTMGGTIGTTQIVKRPDGGPTGWQANIIGSNPTQSYREFALEFQDLQLAYYAPSRSSFTPYPVWTGDTTAAFLAGVKAYNGWVDNNNYLGNSATMAQQLISSSGNIGTYSLNYRNEPIPLRTASYPQTSSTVPQATGSAGDLSYAFSSDVQRADPSLNSQPATGSAIASGSVFTYPQTALTPGMDPGDPFTPLLRAYQGDSIQIRTLVGAHLLPHSVTVHGVDWLYEPSEPNSGYRSSYVASLSEHFEPNFRLPNTSTGNADFLYSTSLSGNGLNNGLWGILRGYKSTTNSLVALPNNTPGYSSQNCGCPTGAPVRTYTVVAMSAQAALDSTVGNPANGALVYNPKFGFSDPNAIIYFRQSDLTSGTYNRSTAVEPLILRARPGECVKVTLVNKFNPTTDKTFSTLTGLTSIWKNANTLYSSLVYQASPSSRVGLNAQLLSYDVTTSDGSRVGHNADQTIAPDSTRTYSWYAGIWQKNGSGYTPVPVEFGSANLTAPDPLLQWKYGLIGSIVVEPSGSVWTEDAGSHASATVFASSSDSAQNKPAFREFVTMLQNNVSVSQNSSSYTAVNYRTEPQQNRVSSTVTNLAKANLAAMYADSAFGQTIGGLPSTPIFTASAGTPIRVRMLHAYGTGTSSNIAINGYPWQEEPYQNNSTTIGTNPLSEWMGARSLLLSANSYDLLLGPAGGPGGTTGDYLYASYVKNDNYTGMWGVMTVTPPQQDAVRMIAADLQKMEIKGQNTVDPTTNKFASTINVYSVKGASRTLIGTIPVDTSNGSWKLATNVLTRQGKTMLQKLINSQSDLLLVSGEGGSIKFTNSELKTFEAVRRAEETARAVKAPSQTPDLTRPLLPGEQPFVAPLKPVTVSSGKDKKNGE